jgi:small nuclear ribonucleoprotein (snRNP)-like protein
MRNLPRPFLVIGLVTTLLLSTVTVAAQGTANDWSRVTALASGSNLSVKLKSGKTVNGTLSSASDSTLSVTSKNAPVEIKREDVRSVHEVVKKGSAAKATLIGMGVGAGAGALLGAIADASNDDGFESFDKAATGVLAVGGAGVGALVGYLVGRSRSKRVLVYQAK